MCERLPSAKRFYIVVVVVTVLVESYTCEQKGSYCCPPMIVTECCAGLVKTPGREARCLIKVRRILLEIGACVGNPHIRCAEPFHRVRNACTDLEETILVSDGQFDVPFNFQVVFGVEGFFRVDGGLEI